ncbi:MAG: arginine--tRNA ligase [Chloroflexota bacterium]
MFDKERTNIENIIRDYCSAKEIPLSGDFHWTRIPFSGEWGISTSFFQLAAAEAKAGKKVVVPQRAAELAESIAKHLGTPPGFSRVEGIKGYLNLYYSSASYSRQVVDTVLESKQDYGKGAAKNKRIMVEFSQPNTHKAIHVGHLRNMILGNSLANILEAAGFEVVRANYIGDYGKDVVKWLWNYQKNHAGEQPPEDITRWMGDLYAEATKNLEDNPQGEVEIREIFSRWDEGDEEIISLWEQTRQWSLDGFNQVYEIMNIPFERIYYESEVEKPGKKIVADLIERGIAIDERASGGTVIVKLDELLGLQEEKYRVLVLLRSDGTALYGAWDLALAQLKFQEYELDLSLYVVDVRQSLHFQQVFKTLEIAGHKDIVDKVQHLPYEVVNLPGNLTMSSRDGIVVLLEDLIREAKQRAYEVSLDRNPEIEEEIRREVADAVGLGAIKYPMLARDNTKIATFDWESALDFNGQTAPYIQYARVRANSILKRWEQSLPDSSTPAHDLDATEIALIELISRLPEEIQRAAKDFKTLHITNLAYEIAKAFNNFYNQCQVLKAEPAIRDYRLRLVLAAKYSIANLLSLLGINAPDVM